jgi:hypothetical protein
MDGAQRRGVGADAEERRVPERDEAGIAREHVPGEAEAGPHQHQGHHKLVVGVADRQRDGRVDRGEHEEWREGAQGPHLRSAPPSGRRSPAASGR